ncbi:MAG TPA: SDR family NAD(P)-dependent oxidoreductase [Haliangiales bacterium]|nr:SDR family NAD(P)-dependent oxidoreductase [Haliangiales bacterium]
MHALVTGASAGIGEAIARELARAGARLVLVARRRELLDKLAAELGEAHRVIAADLGDPARATSLAAEVGDIDVLVNNAGVQIVGPTIGTPPEEGENLLRINVFSPMRLVLACLPAMVARGSGTIVNIASLAALAPAPGMFYYNASKAALGAASEALRGELRGTGVNVVTVYPGPVRTAMEQAAWAKYERTLAVPTGTAEELAVLVRRAIERRRARIIYPRIYATARWFPGTARYLTDRLTPRLKA